MVTRYLNGSQGIPYHSDDEESIGTGTMICSISLGETRNLHFRSKNNSSVFNSSVQLGHGDFLFMTQKSQNYFEHSIPKDFSTNMRISITLRQIVRSPVGTSIPDSTPELLSSTPVPSHLSQHNSVRDVEQDAGNPCVAERVV